MLFFAYVNDFSLRMHGFEYITTSV